MVQAYKKLLQRLAPVLLVPVLLLPVLATVPAAARAAHFIVVPGDQTGIVFESRAPMEKFQGKTRQVSGWLDADLDDLTSPVRLAIQVDLASFDTGMGKRNKHMRKNHFETDRYPVAVFTGGQVTSPGPSELAVGGTTELELTGTLDLHGVKHEMTCAVTLTRPASDAVQVEAKFVVLLPDHNIKRPRFLVMKLAEDQRVTARLLLRKGP